MTAYKIDKQPDLLFSYYATYYSAFRLIKKHSWYQGTFWDWEVVPHTISTDPQECRHLLTKQLEREASVPIYLGEL